MARATPTSASLSPPHDDPAPTGTNSMETHVKVVGVLNLIGGLFVAAAALFVLLAFGIATGATSATQEDGTPGWVPGFLASLGLVFGIVLALFALVGILAGVFLLQRRASGKMWGIISSVLHIVNIGVFPFTTALGIYGLVILLNKDTDRLLVN